MIPEMKNLEPEVRRVVTIGLASMLLNCENCTDPNRDDCALMKYVENMKNPDMDIAEIDARYMFDIALEKAKHGNPKP